MRQTRAVLAAVVLVAGISVGASGENDAGRGSDASDNPATPLQLEGYLGTQANLSAPYDADWFGVAHDDRSNPACVEVFADGLPRANVTLETYHAGSTTLATGHFHPANPTLGQARAEAALALARPHVSSTKLGVYPTPNPPGEGSPTSKGVYNFTVKARNASHFVGDAGLGGDAGGSPATARPIDGLACIGGTVDVLLGFALDGIDYYSFEGRRGTLATVSLAHAGGELLELNLVAPSGASLSVRNGEVAYALLTENGTHHLAVQVPSGLHTSALALSYLVGLGVDQSPGAPCRPICTGI